MKRKLVLVLLIVAIPLSFLIMLGGARKEAGMPPANQTASPMSPAAQKQLASLGYVDSDAESKGRDESQSSPISRKIVRTGEVTMRVKSVDSFLRVLEKQLQISGGYVAGVEMDRASSSASALVTVKVKPESLAGFVWWLKEQGDVNSEKMSAEDISEEYYDLKARLENARKLETRLQEMLRTNTAKLSDLLALEEKLSEVRERIETMEGSIRMYDHLVALATFTIRVSAELPQTVQQPPAYFEQVNKAWHASTRMLADFVRETGLAIVVISPWMVIVMPVVLAVWYLLRRRRAFAAQVS